MLILSYIIGFIIGIFFFMIINEMFDIYYFGFKGIFSTFCGCWFAGTLIVLFFGWFAIIAIPIVLVVRSFSGGKSSPGEESEVNETSNENSTD